LFLTILFGKDNKAKQILHKGTNIMSLRYKSEGPGSIPGVAGFFSVASDSSMCPGVDSASENEYQVNPGGKGGRCVRLTTYHLHVPMSRNLGALTSWNPVGLFRPVMGQLYLYQYKVLLLCRSGSTYRQRKAETTNCHIL
jgi:hypothetical protein